MDFGGYKVHLDESTWNELLLSETLGEALVYTYLSPKILSTLFINTNIYMEQNPSHIIYVYLISPS